MYACSAAVCWQTWPGRFASTRASPASTGPDRPGQYTGAGRLPAAEPGAFSGRSSPIAYIAWANVSEKMSIASLPV